MDIVICASAESCDMFLFCGPNIIFDSISCLIIIPAELLLYIFNCPFRTFQWWVVLWVVYIYALMTSIL